jgi:hypothetical protein
MFSLAALLFTFASASTAALPSQRAIVALDTTPLYAAPPAADAATADSTTAANTLESRALTPATVMLAPTLLGERLANADTVRRRRKAVVLSDAAILRLRIHRYASYTVIPLFALQ